MLSSAASFSVDEVDDTVRQTSLVHDAGEGKGKQRGILWTLPHTCVSAHDGWNHLPKWNGCREVASVDDAADTKGAAVGEQFLVRQFRIDGLTVKAAAFGLEKQTCVNSLLNRTSSFFQGLSNFTGFKSNNCILVFHEQATHVSDNLASGWGRCCSPSREGIVGRIQSCVHICFCREREVAKGIGKNGWVDRGECGTIACKGQLTVDDVVPSYGGFTIWIFVGKELKAGF